MIALVYTTNKRNGTYRVLNTILRKSALSGNLTQIGII